MIQIPAEAGFRRRVEHNGQLQLWSVSQSIVSAPTQNKVIDQFSIFTIASMEGLFMNLTMLPSVVCAFATLR